jgi:hypothetical protein
MPHTRRYVIEIKDSETDAVVICRAADWTDKEKRARHCERDAAGGAARYQLV